MPEQIVIAIKRSQSNNAPASLANGELAYSFSSDKLYIGQTDTSGSAVSVEYIGGKLLVDKVANLESIVMGTDVDRTFSSITVQEKATVEKLVLTNFVENGLMYTAANGMVVQATGTSGQIMQVSNTGAPVFDDLNGGEYS
jgi:hypothetical protein